MLDTLQLGLNTTVVGMGIVFLVLVALWAIIAIQSKLVSMAAGAGSNSKESPDSPAEPVLIPQKTGKAEGSLQAPASLDDEALVVMLSAISEDTDIPLEKLSVTSIKEI